MFCTKSSREQLLHLEYVKSISQRQLDGLGPLASMSTKYLEARFTKYLEARYRVLIKWGDESAALGKLIEDLALLQESQALGFTATEQQLTENIQYARDAFDNGEYDSYNKGYIESIGEDTYWNEVYPVKAEMMLSINNLHDHLMAEGQAVLYHDSKTIWIDFTEATLAKTTIVLSDTDHHSTSLEDVLGFLADVREVDRESLMTTADQSPTAPAETWVVYIRRTDGTLETINSDAAATVCSSEDEDGNVSRWICDAATEKETLADLEDAVLYIIVEPGDPLPIFTQDE